MSVMPGLVPGIHVLFCCTKNVDGRDKPGHDESETSVPAWLYEFEILIIRRQWHSQKLRRANEQLVHLILTLH